MNELPTLPNIDADELQNGQWLEDRRGDEAACMWSSTGQSGGRWPRPRGNHSFRAMSARGQTVHQLMSPTRLASTRQWKLFTTASSKSSLARRG